MSQITMNSTTLAGQDVVSDVGARSKGLFNSLRQALTVRSQRHALMALDQRMLSDIGLSEADAWQEANRSFFDLSSRQPTRR